MGEETLVGVEDLVSLTVHGAEGVVDLSVPRGATALDVARAYAAEAGTGSIPLLSTRLGSVLPGDRTLSALGIVPGAVLIASTGIGRPRRAGILAQVRRIPPSPELAALLAAVGTALATVAVFAGLTAPTDTWDWEPWAVVALFGAAALCCAPVGRHVASRRAAAPALVGLAVVVLMWADSPERHVAALGTAALASAAAAAIARIPTGGDEWSTVWIGGGVLVAGVCALPVLGGWAPQVAWALLLAGAAFAARTVPALAVQVPDDALLDLDRLAVTAWSARDQRGRARRSRMLVGAAEMNDLVASATRSLTAAATIVAAVVAIAAPMVLREAVLDLDRVGARVLVGCAGAALLLAARGHRHRPARLLLGGSGLVAWGVLTLHLAGAGVLPPGAWIAAVCCVLGGALVAVAVATGRGWRSAWWSRRAEVAESLSMAALVASCVVATGLFRLLWEITS